MVNASIESDNCSVVATATLRNDGLYYIDDLTKFLLYEGTCIPCTHIYYSKAGNIDDLPDNGNRYATPATHDTRTAVRRKVLESIINKQNKLIEQLRNDQENHIRGSSRIKTRSTTVGMNPLEILHVKLGHVGEDTIKWAARNNSLVGLGFTYDDIKHLTLKLCPACMEGKMEAFPVPPSLTSRVYNPFEYLSVDILIWTYTSVRGFRYTALYVDKSTKYLFHYHMKTKNELLDTFKQLIKDHGKDKNPRAVEVRYLQGDSGSELLSQDFTDFTKERNIILLIGAPYKHEQVLVEPYVKQVKNGLRTVLAYNNTPLYYYCYGFDYFIDTYNKLPRIGFKESRHELLYGEKPDVSDRVPFYSDGYYQVSPEERVTLNVAKPFQLRGRRCRMLGYPTYPHLRTKNSYICLRHGTAKDIVVRHDCYFKHFTDNEPSLLSAEVEKRSQDTFIPDPIVDYSVLFQSESSTNDSSEIAEVSTPDENNVVIKELFERKNVYDEYHHIPRSEDDSSYFNIPTNSNEDTMYNNAVDLNINNDSRTLTDIDEEPRRSGRTRRATVRFAYCATATSTAFITTEDVNVDDTSEVNLSDVPKSMTEAATRRDAAYWELGCDTEMTRITERSTYSICSEEEQDDPSLRPMKSKFAFRLTRKPDGSLKYKVRLVACGYSQIYGKDYEQTYAPTASYNSFCILMQLAATHGWFIKGIDVENAYLEAPIDKEIYMYLPPERFKRPNGKPIKVKLNRSLYGLKQAGELWFQYLREKLIGLGFTPCIHDRCIYKKIDPESGTRTYVIVYVDDIIFMGNNEKEIDDSIESLGSQFRKISELGEITRYIGVDIERDLERHTISLSQIPYVETYLKDNDNETNLSSKPMPFSPTLDYDAQGDGTIKPIREETGKLRYLADRTRPELLFHVGKLARAGDKPSANHISGLKHINRYLKGTTQSKLTLGGDDREIRLFGLSDASYMTRHDSLSQLAYCFFLNRTSGTICARSKKDTTVSHSSAEAEIKAIDLAVLKALWIRGLLSELGYPQTEPTVIYTDSISAKTLAETMHTSSSSAHLVVRINFIHQEIAAGTIVLKYIDTNNMVADVLTKALPATPFEKHRDKLLKGFDNELPIVTKRPKKVKSSSRRLGKKLKK